MTNELISVSRSGAAVHLGLNRPERRNALSVDLAEALIHAAQSATRDSTVKALVVYGKGSSFCAGADVGSATDSGGASIGNQVAMHTHMSNLFETFEKLPVAKIAKIHGPAVGAGLVLAGLCELRAITPEAFFSLPELDFGVPFSMGGLPRLARLIGPTATADMLLTGRRVAGHEAERIGLATKACEPQQLDDVVNGWVETIARRSSFLIANSVRRLRETSEAMIDSNRSDIDSLVLATLDPQSADISSAYASQITGKRD